MNSGFSQQREIMVDGQIRTRDVTNVPVLQAFGEIPRELFVTDNRRDLAYMDEDLEIVPATSGAEARYLMEPAVLAKIFQLAELKPSDLVLDIGCMTGYSTAILSRIASYVVGLENDPNLAQKATLILEELDCVNTSIVTGPLQDGHQADAPYDVIVLEGSVEFIPDALLSQLRENGRLIAVVGVGYSARAQLFVKKGDTISSRLEFNAAIKPLPGFRKTKGFVF